MKLSLNNFLTMIKQIVVGGGVEKDGVTPNQDAGFLKDTNYSLEDVVNDSGAVLLTDSTTGVAATTLVDVTVTPTQATINANFASIAVQLNRLIANSNGTASETNLLVNSYAASTTNAGTVNFVVPRDYDEQTDTFAVHVGLAMSGSTDTPGITATAYRKRPGSNIVTVATSVAGKTRAGATAALSAAEQVVVFNFSRNGLLMDDALTIVFTVAAHTTNALLQYYIQPVYRSTLVAYHESTGGTRDGKDGTFLR